MESSDVISNLFPLVPSIISGPALSTLKNSGSVSAILLEIRTASPSEYAANPQKMSA